MRVQVSARFEITGSTFGSVVVVVVVDVVVVVLVVVVVVGGVVVVVVVVAGGVATVVDVTGGASVVVGSRMMMSSSCSSSEVRGLVIVSRIGTVSQSLNVSKYWLERPSNNLMVIQVPSCAPGGGLHPPTNCTPVGA